MEWVARSSPVVLHKVSPKAGLMVTAKKAQKMALYEIVFLDYYLGKYWRREV